MPTQPSSGSPPRRTLSRWQRILVVNAIGGFAAFGISLETGRPNPWLQLLGSMIYANCIGGLIAATMPGIAGMVRDRSRATQWAVRALAIPVLIVIGSVVAGWIVIALGGNSPDRFLVGLLASLKISLAIATVATLGVMAYETMRRELDATSLALRTKERDEAEARRVAVEAQLASLESRVNPRFLFNTLNSIAALTHTDPSGAERMTSQLAALMRSSLDGASTPLMSLDEEVRLVRDYLEIERVRFGDRLRFSIEVGEGAGQMRVPRLSLQTLVENSVKYAIGPCREGGRIAIRASVTEGVTRLDVEDAGPGFDASDVREGHGLALLKSRLAMTFGGRATLHIDGRQERTCVTIEIPEDQMRSRRTQ